MVDGAASKQDRLRELPSVDDILVSETGREIGAQLGAARTAAVVRGIVEQLRSEILSQDVSGTGRELKTQVLSRLADHVLSERRARLGRVINATGVLLHTNLGRAPLSEGARAAVMDASGYCSLELSLETGKRSGRAQAAEALVCELTGAEAALIVNNCAAAALLALSKFAGGGEAIVSRGELVEIGGGFRVPDVLEQSGAKLREVGTTNRTKIADYAAAVTPDSRMILRVHSSNYRIVGFTAAPELSGLVDLARDNDLLLYEDIGSGAMIDLSAYGLGDEPSAAASIAAGVDIVTFSGDKLLGGPQAGIIAGKAELIEELRKHPLYRALRLGKLELAALEATLDSYRRDPSSEIPILKMLAADKSSLEARSRLLIDSVRAEVDGLELELIEGSSAVGGGSAPAAVLPTVLVALTHPQLSATRLELKLRRARPPVLARIADDKVLIDLRTVSLDEEDDLVTALTALV